MKPLVLMVAISSPGGQYTHQPLFVSDRAFCLEVADLINEQFGDFRHAYCKVPSLAPQTSPRPKGRSE